MTFGLRLLGERRKLGLVQQEAADILGIRRDTLMDIERGRVTLTKPDYDRFIEELRKSKTVGSSASSAV